MTAVECYRCPRVRKRHALHLAECETMFNRSFPRFALALKLLSLSTLNKACLIRNSAESPAPSICPIACPNHLQILTLGMPTDATILPLCRRSSEIGNSSLSSRVLLPKCVDKTAFIEAAQNPIIDEILQPKPVDTRIAQFHQTLNIAQALNGRERFALDAVDHVEIALLSRRGVVELEPLHDRTNHRAFVARRQAKGDSFEQSFYQALGGLALLPQQAVLGDHALRRKRDVRLRKLGQNVKAFLLEPTAEDAVEHRHIDLPGF